MEVSESEVRKYSLCCCEIDSLYHEFAVCMGMSDTAMRVLYIMKMHEGTCLLSEIVRLSGISKQTIHSAVKKLEKEGILQIENHNGRKKIVSFSEKGKLVAEQNVNRLVEMENEILSLYEPEELKIFFDMTNRYMTEFKRRINKLAEEKNLQEEKYAKNL